MVKEHITYKKGQRELGFTHNHTESRFVQPLEDKGEILLLSTTI